MFNVDERFILIQLFVHNLMHNAAELEILQSPLARALTAPIDNK